MCCALGKPEPLMGQLSEPIPGLQHLPSPTFPSPLALCGSLVPHPTTVSTQTWGGSGRADVGTGQKLHLSQRDMRTPRWFEISCFVLSTRQGLGPGVDNSSQHISTLAVPGLCAIQRFCSHKTLSEHLFPPTPATSSKREGREGATKELCGETPQNSSRKMILQDLWAQGL